MQILKDIFDDPQQAHFYAATLGRLCNIDVFADSDKQMIVEKHQVILDGFLELLPNLLKTKPKEEWSYLFWKYLNPSHYQEVQKNRLCVPPHFYNDVKPDNDFKDLPVNYIYKSLTNSLRNKKDLKGDGVSITNYYNGVEFRKILERSQKSSWEALEDYQKSTLHNFKNARNLNQKIVNEYGFKSVEVRYKKSNLLNAVEDVQYIMEALQKINAITGIHNLGFSLNAIVLGRTDGDKEDNTLGIFEAVQQEISLYDTSPNPEKIVTFAHEWLHSLDNHMIKNKPPFYASKMSTENQFPEFLKLLQHLEKDYINHKRSLNGIGKSLKDVFKKIDVDSKTNYLVKNQEMIARSFELFFDETGKEHFGNDMAITFSPEYLAKNRELWTEFFKNYNANQKLKLSC